MDKYKLSEEEKATLQYRVTTKLRAAILKGAFRPGERLIQEEWAEKLGVSRMPIREALRQLEIEGLVSIEPRRGAVVTPISVEDIEEIYQLRAMLEGLAVEKSQPFLDEEDIEELETLVQQMKSLKADEKDVVSYMQLNARFHQVLRQGCPWRRIHGFIEMLWKGIPPYTPSLLSNHLQESHKEHEEMLKYLKAERPDLLKKVMQKHILRTRDELLKLMQEGRK